MRLEPREGDSILRFKKPVLILILFILIAAAINFPFATFFLKSRRDAKGATVAQITGPEAVALGWPSDTPHETEWPQPGQWQETRSFAYRHIQVWGGGSHQMEYQLIGWPLPVYEQVQMWWPWNDPTWQTTEQHDPALGVCWSGALLNPIIVGGAAWLVLVMPIFVGVSLRKQLRTLRGHCIKCGYDLRGDLEAGCPECGWNRSAVDGARREGGSSE